MVLPFFREKKPLTGFLEYLGEQYFCLYVIGCLDLNKDPRYIRNLGLGEQSVI